MLLKLSRLAVLLLLLCVSIAGFLRFGGCFIVLGAPKVKVSCVATNYPSVLVHRSEDGKTSRLEEVDDWRVNCTVTLDDKKLFDQALMIPHPTPYREAMDAIDFFRTKQAPKIVKEKGEPPK